MEYLRSFREPHINSLRKRLCFSSSKFGYNSELRISRLVINNITEVSVLNYERFELARQLMSVPNALTTRARLFNEKYGSKLLNFFNSNTNFCKHRFLAKPLSKAALKKSKRASFLWRQFLRNDLSEEEFFKYLSKIEDAEVVAGILEHRLGWKMGCVSKTLWRCYFDFLQKRGDSFVSVQMSRHEIECLF